MKYSEAKRQSAVSIETALKRLVKRRATTEDFRDLKKSLNDFENNAGNKPYDNLSLDESGMLVCRHRIDLGERLSSDEAGNKDRDLARAVLNEANESMHYSQESGDWYAEICFGAPSIINYPPERGHYAVYSSELSLKINSIESEEHGILLVERASRKHGIFGDVVSCDRYGSCSYISTPKEVREATDEGLSAMIDKIENNESEE